MTILRSFVLLLYWFSQVLQADSPITVTIAADSSYPPYSYTQDGKITGIYTDIIQNVVKKMPKYQVSILALPWKRALLKVKEDEIPFIYPPYFRPKQRPYLTYSHPLLSEFVVLFCHADVMKQKKRHAFPQDFQGLTVGNNLGYLMGDNIQKAHEDGVIKLVTTPDAEAALRKIYSRRLDCYVNDRLSVLYELKMLKSGKDIDERLLVEAVQFTKEDAFLGAISNSPQHPYAEAFLQEFNEHLKALIGSGQLDDLIQRYIQ